MDHTPPPIPALRRIACALALAFPAGTALSQQADAPALETVVVSAAGYEQKIADAPASISVVTQEELTRKPYTTLLDAVREIEGVDVGETTDKTGQGSISIRGMGADYTLVLIDGKRQNNVGDLYPNNFGGNQFNHIPPLEMIERVEIIRGPMSTLYGADAIGGVINIITRKVGQTWHGALTHSQSFEENPDFGNERTTDFMAMGPVVPGLLGLALRGAAYQREASNPEYAPVTDPAGTPHERALGFGGGGRTVDNKNWTAGVRLSLTPGERHEIVLDLDSSRQQYDNAQSQLGTLDSIASIWRATNAGAVQPRVGYAADQRFTRDQWSLTHKGRYDFGNSELALSYVETANLGRSMPFTVAEREALQALWNAACGGAPCRSAALAALDPAQRAELDAFLPRERRTLETRQYTLDGKLELPLGDHLVIVGGQYVDAEMEDGVFGLYGDRFEAGKTQPHRQWAVFAEDNWALAPQLTLTGGVRHDHHNMFGGQTSPRLYAVWSASPAWTVKGGLSTGYKPPRASQLFPGITGFGGQGVTPFVGNPDLKPETSVSAELAAYFTHPAGHEVNATLFANRFKDKIVSGDSVPNCELARPGEPCADVGDGWADLGYTTFTQNDNIDRADVRGAELAGRYQLLPGLALRANYTYTDSEQKSGLQKGQPLTGTARHLFNTTLSWRARPGLDLFLTMSAQSKRYRSWDTATDKALYYKDYQIFHLGGSYKVNPHLTLNARINNLFDRDFTGYAAHFTDNGDGSYTPVYHDDYNLKAKARSLWISANLRF